MLPDVYSINKGSSLSSASGGHSLDCCFITYKNNNVDCKTSKEGTILENLLKFHIQQKGRNFTVFADFYSTANVIQ